MTNNREHICKYYLETVNNYVILFVADDSSSVVSLPSFSLAENI